MVVTDDKYEDVVCRDIGVDYRDDAVLIASAPELKAERDRLREALQGLMQAVDGCLTPSEVLLWKKCEEALKGSEK